MVIEEYRRLRETQEKEFFNLRFLLGSVVDG